MRRLYALLPLLLLSSITVTAQEFDTVRVCTYHLLEFRSDQSAPLEELRIILNAIRPNILFVQEVIDSSAFAHFRDSIAARLNRPLSTPFLLQPNEHMYYTAIFYDSSLFDRPRIQYLPDLPRQTIALRLYRKGLVVEDSIDFIACHWRGGPRRQDANQRHDQAKIVRDYLSAPNAQLPHDTNAKVVFGGDLNLATSLSSEPAYERITYEGPGMLIDPIGRPGAWQENEAFADIHTTSTRTRLFGSGSYDGMQNRFDQLFLSPMLMEQYVPASYTTFGNDGQHFNDSINALPNLAAGPVMAQALHDASDHLPVYLDLVFPRVVTDVLDGIQSSEQLDLVSRERQ